MATLAAIQKQIADLERQAEVIRKKETAAAAAKARELISTYQLSIDDLGLGGKAARKGAASKGKAGPAAGKRKVAAAKPAGIPKYQDPKSGKTWTGTGKPPGWIASAKNRDKFLIVAAATAAVPASAVPAAAPKAGKPGRAAGRAAGKKVAVASKPSTKATRAAASVAVPPLATRKPGAKRKLTQAASAAAGAAKAPLATTPAAAT